MKFIKKLLRIFIIGCVAVIFIAAIWAAILSLGSDTPIFAVVFLVIAYSCYRFLRRNKKAQPIKHVIQDQVVHNNSTSEKNFKKTKDTTKEIKKSLDLSVSVFGKSGTGKTVLLASFFGYHQDGSVETKNGYTLSLAGLKEGKELLNIYHNIQDKGTLKNPGSSDYRKYIFKFKIPNIKQTACLHWHDYPGGWLENDPKDPGEAEERQLAFERLINCDVAFLLIDGLELSNLKNDQRASYIGYTIDQFKNAFNNIYGNVGRSIPFPKIWVLCVSKADLLPDYTGEDFYRDVKKVEIKLESLKSSLLEASQTPEIKISLGEHFLLLSSAQIDKSGNVIDPNQKSGIDLITPLGLRLPLIYKYRKHSYINSFIALGVFPAAFITWLLTDDPFKKAFGIPFKDVFGVPINTLLTLGAAQLTKKAQEAKERKNSMETVFLTMLETLQLAEDSGSVYFHKNISSEANSNG